MCPNRASYIAVHDKDYAQATDAYGIFSEAKNFLINHPIGLDSWCLVVSHTEVNPLDIPVFATNIQVSSLDDAYQVIQAIYPTSREEILPEALSDRVSAYILAKKPSDVGKSISFYHHPDIYVIRRSDLTIDIMVNQSTHFGRRSGLEDLVAVERIQERLNDNVIIPMKQTKGVSLRHWLEQRTLDSSPTEKRTHQNPIGRKYHDPLPGEVGKRKWAEGEWEREFLPQVKTAIAALECASGSVDYSSDVSIDEIYPSSILHITFKTLDVCQSGE